MKLVWHIVKKDFRRLWVPLALWTLLLIAKDEVGVRALAGDSGVGDRLFYLRSAETAAQVLDFIVSVLLVAALVQDDALVGTGMFWATRPISGGRLLAAKLLGGALMFGVWPLIVSVRWWIVCDYDGAEMARAALVTLDMRAPAMLVALALAALTKDLGRFLAWLLGLGAVTVAWAFTVNFFVNVTRAEITTGVLQTQEVFSVAVEVVAGAAVIASQFFTRRLGRSVTIAVVAAGLAGTVVTRDWDFSRLWARTPRASPLAGAMTVSLERAKIGPAATLEFSLKNVADDFGAEVRGDHLWTWSDGKSAAARTGFETASWPGWAEWRALGLRGAKSDPAVRAYVASGPEGARGGEVMRVAMKPLLWAEKASRLQTEPAAYTGDFEIRLLKPELIFELPLRVGEERRLGSSSVRVEHADWAEGEVHLIVRESRPDWRRYGGYWPKFQILIDGGGDAATGWALVNRARGEAIKLWPGGGRSELMVGRQNLGWFTLNCRVPIDAITDKPGRPPHWLEGATLAVVRYHEVARVDREVKVAQFAPTDDN